MSIKTQTLFPVPFANSAGATYRYTITQTNETDNANKATFDDGFPAVTMQPIEAGGIPMFGQDFNGILYQITSALREIQAGNPITYNSDFATSIGGYAINSIILGSDGKFYQAIKDSVTTDPVSDTTNWKLWLNFLPQTGGTLSGDLTAPNITAKTSLTVGSAKATYSATGLNFDKPLLVNNVAVLKKGDAVPFVGLIPTGTDLNTLIGSKNGVYYQTYSANATLALNYPVASRGGALVVHDLNGQTSCSQRFMIFGTNDEYLRNYNQNNKQWSAWFKQITTEDISSYQSGLGINQTWQNVTTERQANVKYTNKTGKPIQVIIEVEFKNGTLTKNEFYVDDTLVSYTYRTADYNNSPPFFVIVPNESTYILKTNLSIEIWNELR